RHRTGVPPDDGENGPRSRIPHPDGPVEAGGAEALTVRAEGHGADLVSVPPEHGAGVDGVIRVPELDRVVIAGRGDRAAGGAQRDGSDRAFVPAEVLVDQTPVPGVPDAHHAGRGRGAERPSVRAPGQLQDRSRLALEAERGEARGDVVEHEAAVRARPGEAAAVGAERDGMNATGQIVTPALSCDPDRPPRFPGAAIPEEDKACPLEAG